MPDGSDPFEATITPAIDAVDAVAWNACAGEDNPFLSHAFLCALEQSAAVSPEAGWQAQHILLHDPASGDLLACAPLYLKAHSNGEYVFDWNWAEAYERAGGSYYPKLLSAVPFTPVTGPRLLVADDVSPALRLKLKTRLVEALVAVATRLGVSSLHANFLNDDDARAFAAANFVPRRGLQYHWQNRGYKTFDDFLATLTARKRKAIKKERRAVEQAGVTISRFCGDSISEAHWDAMYGFYVDTGTRKWGRPYLNRETFRQLGETMAERVVMVMAERDGRIIAGALNFVGGDALYGRYWGCSEHVPYLHFEVCYHQAIEAAIEAGLARVEAGAQGEHKISRGYLPVETHSAHWFIDPGLKAAVENFTQMEGRAVEHEMKVLLEDSPYKDALD